MEEYDAMFKILTLGDSGTGKTSLIDRFTRDTFSEFYEPTEAADFQIRTTTMESMVVKLQIWDTRGQEKFRTITESYYRGAHGIVLVFDLTNTESMDHINSWLGEVERYTCESVYKVIVGNKCDLSHVSESRRAEARKFADALGIVYFEASAKVGIGVEEAFEKLTMELMSRRVVLDPSDHRAKAIELSPTSTTPSDGSSTRRRCYV